MRRISAVALALLALVAPAVALTPGQRAVLLSGAPSWVLRANGQLPAVHCLLTQNMCWVRGQGTVPASALLALTRASNETVTNCNSNQSTVGNNALAISCAGLQIWQASTNFLLNSGTPATQTTGSLGTGTYTLWITGSGSATMSAGTGTGCGTGAATAGSPVSFTITVAGTCTVTVAGSPTTFQLEALLFLSPYIPTTAGTAARSQDGILATGALLAALESPNGTVLAKTSGVHLNIATASSIVGTGPGAFTSLLIANTQPGGSNFAQMNNGTQSLSTANAFTGGIDRSGASWTAGTRELGVNSGSIASDANGVGAITSAKIGSLISASGGGNTLNANLQVLVVYNFNLSSAALASAIKGIP